MPEQNPKDLIFKTPPLTPAMQQPHRSFFVRHIVAEILAVAFVIALGAVGYYWQTTRIEAPKFEPVKHDNSWKVYSSAEYGFEFQYPKDMSVVKVDSGRPGFMDGMSFGISYPKSKWNYSVDVKSSKMSLQEAFEENYNFWKSTVSVNSDYQLKDFTVSDTEVDGVKAKKLSINNFGDMGSTMVSVVNNGYAYLIAGGGRPEDNVDEFISKLKFTELIVINSFDSCVAAGNPMQKSYPAKCITEDGITFVQVINACIQVIQSAKNPKTGEIRDFPTPCDVPEGWIKVNNAGI